MVIDRETGLLFTAGSSSDLRDKHYASATKPELGMNWQKSPPPSRRAFPQRQHYEKCWAPIPGRHRSHKKS